MPIRRRRPGQEPQPAATETVTPIVEPPLPDCQQPLPFRQESYSPLGVDGASHIIRDVIMRQTNGDTTDPSINEQIRIEQARIASDPVLNTLSDVVNGIRTGGSLEGFKSEINKLISNQEDRAELIDNLMLTHQYDRLIRYVKARAYLESYLIACVQRQDLSPTEALAFMKIVMTETETISNRIKSGGTNVNDLMSLINKADFTTQINEADLAKKFSDTTPQGREIVRRLAHRLTKGLSGGKATKVNDEI